MCCAQKYPVLPLFHDIAGGSKLVRKKWGVKTISKKIGGLQHLRKINLFSKLSSSWLGIYDLMKFDCVDFDDNNEDKGLFIHLVI